MESGQIDQSPDNDKPLSLRFVVLESYRDRNRNRLEGFYQFDEAMDQFGRAHFEDWGKSRAWPLLPFDRIDGSYLRYWAITGSRHEGYVILKNPIVDMPLDQLNSAMELFQQCRTTFRAQLLTKKIEPYTFGNDEVIRLSNRERLWENDQVWIFNTGCYRVRQKGNHRVCPVLFRKEDFDKWLSPSGKVPKQLTEKLADLIIGFLKSISENYRHKQQDLNKWLKKACERAGLKTSENEIEKKVWDRMPKGLRKGRGQPRKSNLTFSYEKHAEALVEMLHSARNR